MVDASALPDGVDLFRPTNHATLLLASERFRDAVFACELTGLVFADVEIGAPDA